MFDDMQRTLTEAAGAGGLDRYFSTWTLRSYGYDRPARRYPATGGDVDGTFSILFVGDSITEGYDVRAGAEIILPWFFRVFERRIKLKLSMLEFGLLDSTRSF